MRSACSQRILHNGYKLDGKPRILNRSYSNDELSNSSNTFITNTSKKFQQHIRRPSCSNNNINKRKNKAVEHDQIFTSNTTEIDANNSPNSLDLILAKLQELDSIKSYLAKLDSQFLTFTNHD